jgi:hypothetical protein
VKLGVSALAELAAANVILPLTPSDVADIGGDCAAGCVSGGSVISVPPLPSEAKSSVALKSTNVRLAVWLPSVTVRRPVEALYDSAK